MQKIVKTMTCRLDVMPEYIHIVHPYSVMSMFDESMLKVNVEIGAPIKSSSSIGSHLKRKKKKEKETFDQQ